MPHAHGTHLGGVRTLEELRLRCVCRPGSDCWEFRDARGRVPDPRKATPQIWLVAARKRVPVTVAAWTLAGRDRPEQGLRIGRTCDSRHCANPAHLAAMTQQQIVELAMRRGSFDTEPRKRAIAAMQYARTKVPAWAHEMVRDKSKTAREWAAHWGCSPSTINAIRSRGGAGGAGRAAA